MTTRISSRTGEGTKHIMGGLDNNVSYDSHFYNHAYPLQAIEALKPFNVLVIPLPTEQSIISEKDWFGYERS